MCLAFCNYKVHIFVYFKRLYIPYIGQLKRIDAIRRSPIYSHFDEGISGVSSIRAYGRQEQLITKCENLIDKSQRPFYLIVKTQR